MRLGFSPCGGAFCGRVALSRWRRRPCVRRAAWRGPVRVSRPRTCARAARNLRPACRALTCSTHGPPASYRAQQNMTPASRPPCARIHGTNARRQTLPLHQRLTPDDTEPWSPFPHHLTYSAPPSTSSPSIVPPQLRPLPCIACFPIVPCVHPSLARTVLCVAYILVRACTSPTAELRWRFLCTCFSPVLLRAFLHTSVRLCV